MNKRPSLNSARNFLAGEGRWREKVADAVGVLEHEAAKVGITFGPSHAFHEIIRPPLTSLNPRFNFQHSHLSPRNAVWIGGWADSPLFAGVCTRAAVRLYNWYDGASLASESRALRVYYDRPQDATHNEHVVIAAPIADRIHGRVAYNGGLWVSPDKRGPRDELGGARVSQIVSAMSRMFALYLFDVDWCVATTPEAHRLKGISGRYGWAGVEAASHVESVAGINTEVCLMWSRREDIIAEAARIVRDGIQPPDQPWARP